MKNTLKGLAVVILLNLILGGCSNSKDITDEYKDSIKDISSNILGLIERQGDYIYYVSKKSGGKLFKMKTDSTEKRKLCDDKCKIVAIKDDYIYYEKFDEKGAIYKISIDGKNRQLLVHDFTRSVKLYENWLYYINEDDYNIYRISIDGSRKTRINTDDVLSYFVAGDWVYYNNLKDGRKLYKIRTDGTSRVKLIDDKSSEFVINNDRVYYVNESDNNRIFTVLTDGSRKEPFVDYTDSDIAGMYNNIKSIEVYNGYLYYMREGSVSRVKLDGSEQKELFTTNSNIFKVDNNWIYAYIDYKNTLLGRFKIEK